MNNPQKKVRAGLLIGALVKYRDHTYTFMGFDCGDAKLLNSEGRTIYVHPAVVTLVQS